MKKRNLVKINKIVLNEFLNSNDKIQVESRENVKMAQMELKYDTKK